MSAPCETNETILHLELDQAWEAYEAAREALDKSRRLETSMRLREIANNPVFAAFEHIASIVYGWGKSPEPEDAARAMVLIEETVKTARSNRQDIIARQRERHG